VSDAADGIRIAAPERAGAGEVIELKAMIQHEMETGYRRDQLGKPIPRFILERFECLYNGKRVFRAELFPAIAANPFLNFFIRATESGTLDFRWTDQDGNTFSKRVLLEVV
jgi:sulfur-oxidizing protein SoxZ